MTPKQTFASWTDLVTAVRSNRLYFFYHPPLDLYPTYVKLFIRDGVKSPRTLKVKAFGYPRFTINATHLSRVSAAPKF